MAKIFEDYFSETQADMVSICLEYVDDKADKIYVYGSIEGGSISSDYFYEINGFVLQRDEISRIDDAYDTSQDAQSQVLGILIDDLIQLKKICKNYNKDVPTELKMVYDVKSGAFESNIKYDPMYSDSPDKLSNDIFEEWFHQIKSSKA